MVENGGIFDTDKVRSWMTGDMKLGCGEWRYI